MKTSILTVACSAALVAVTGSAAMSEDQLSGQLFVIAASSECPANVLAGDPLLLVHFVMSDASALPRSATPNRYRYDFRVNAAKAVAPPMVKISGEIRDYGVPGCTVAFEGGTAARLASAVPGGADGLVPQARGCRGACGL